MLGKTLEEHYNNFRGFVSSYFDHPEDWDGDRDKLDLRLRTERATTDSWSQEQWEKIFEPKTAARCEYPMYVLIPFHVLERYLIAPIMMDSYMATL